MQTCPFPYLKNSYFSLIQHVAIYRYNQTFSDVTKCDTESYLIPIEIRSNVYSILNILSKKNYIYSTPPGIHPISTGFPVNMT